MLQMFCKIILTSYCGGGGGGSQKADIVCVFFYSFSYGGFPLKAMSVKNGCCISFVAKDTEGE